MTQKPGTSKDAADNLVKCIHRKTWQHYSAEEKICIVLQGYSKKKVYRREGRVESHYYS